MDEERVDLFAPFLPGECASRLAGAVDVEPSAAFPEAVLGDKSVMGFVTDKRIRLRMRIRQRTSQGLPFRNSFQSHLRAMIEPAAGGCRIVGTIGLHPIVRGFLFVWFSGVILFGIYAVLAALKAIHFSAHELYRFQWIAVVFPAAMLAFGAILVHWGRVLAQDEARDLKNYLLLILNARPIGHG